MTAFFPKDLTLSAAYSNSFYAHHQEIAQKGETPCHSYLVHKTIALLESVPGLRVLVAITELIIAKALMCLCCYCYKEEPPADLSDEKKELPSPRRDVPPGALINEQQPEPFPLGDLPPENGLQAPSPCNPIVDVIKEVVPPPFERPNRPPFIFSFSKPVVTSPLDLNYPFGIGSFLDSHDIMRLTSTSPSLYVNSGRLPALDQVRELAQKRAFMKVRLPDRINRIYEAMQEHGSVEVIPTSNSGRGYLYPNLDEMQSSFAVCQARSGHRAIVLFVEGKGDNSVEISPDDEDNGPATKILIQRVISTIFIMEINCNTGLPGWKLEGVRAELSDFEGSFINHNNLYDHPEIEDAVVSILSGTHPSLRCISHSTWEKRIYSPVTISMKCDVPEGSSLMIRGDGPGVENWEKNFDMLNPDASVWICKILVRKSTEYKLFLRTLMGEFIPEDGPIPSVAALINDLNKSNMAPKFPSIEHFSL